MIYSYVLKILLLLLFIINLICAANCSNSFHNNEQSFVDKRSSQRMPLTNNVIELLRKAYRQGWKPNLKHYIPGSRFGRHR